MAIVANKGNVYEPMDRHWHGNASEVHGGGDAGDESNQSIKDFGAVGDGVTDDSDAFRAALASGECLTGNGGVYAVSGNFELPDGFCIEDATFVQLSPNNASRRTLTKTPGSPTGPGTLRRVKVDRNGSTTDGSVADAAGIWLSNVSDLTLEDVEVTGNSLGAGIMLGVCDRARITRPYIHDMMWTAASDPGSERIAGLVVQISVDVLITEPRISNLLGQIGAGPIRAYQTDGLVIGGSTNVTVNGGYISRCGEAIDTAGSNLNQNVWFYGMTLNNCGGGIKLMSIKRSGAIGIRVVNPGFVGFTIAVNSTTPAGFYTQNIRLVDCMVTNCGAGGEYIAMSPRAFWVEWDGTGTAPTDIQLLDCSAIDTGGTMSWGFFYATGASAVAINPLSVGHIVTYAHVAGLDVPSVPVNFTVGPVYPPSSTVISISQRQDAAMTLPIYLANPSGDAGSEVGISFDTTTNGKNVRDALVVGGTTGSAITYLSFKTAFGAAPAERLRVDVDGATSANGMAGRFLALSDAITAPGVGTGRARIYVDSADGDLKVIFADGVIKTLAVDT